MIISGVHHSQFHGPIIGTSHGAPPPRPEPTPAEPAMLQVGVLTVLPEETRAVADVLRAARAYGVTDLPNGSRVHHALFDRPRGTVRVSALQTVQPGQTSAALAFTQLRQFCSPSIVALVGIAGGISPEIRLADVVIASSVIFYEPRKETPDGVRHRGETRPATATVERIGNAFFSSHPVPCELTLDAAAGGATFRVVRGPIGSGEAVIADPLSKIREFLRQFHEKVLAVETEGAGFSQAFFEEVGGPASNLVGCLVIRGISDHADAAKADDYHAAASRHAARTFVELVNYL